MRIPGIKSVKAFSRWVQARMFGGALILGYHRVADVTEDHYEVCVTPGHFAEQMAVVSKYAHPISLTELVGHLMADSLPPRSVAVTFDDGYADNLYQAKPVLEKYAVPATVFVCTGYAGKEFWWDELERLVMSSQADVHTLRLQVHESRFMWDQPNVSPAAENHEVRSWLRDALYHFLLPLNFEDQNHAMNMIRDWSGLSSEETAAARAMSHQELLQLARGGLIELGSHTRYHPVLPRLSSEKQKVEIESSKRDLEDLLGQGVVGFAYPNGRATDEAKRIVRDAGFTYACTSLHDVVRPGADLYELTRFWQRDVDGDAFAQGLRLWMSVRGNHA